MKIKNFLIDNYLVGVSGFFLVLLFPGFALYNTLVAYVLIPPIFGGYFGTFSVVYLALMIPLFLRLRFLLDNKSVNYLAILVFFYAYIFLYSSLNYLMDSRVEVGEAYFQTLETIVLMLVVFLIGFFVKLSQKLYRILFYFTIVVAILLLFYFLKTGQVMFYARSFTEDSVVEYVSTYQGFARSAIITSLVVLSMTSKLSRYLFVYTISIFILFILGARSEFVGFIFSGALLLLLKFRLSSVRFAQIFIFLALGIVFLYLTYESLSGGRSVQVFDMANDVSWGARKSLGRIGITQVFEHPVLGYFAGHILEGGSKGAYTHNIISVWAGFGLLAFILYVLLCFIPFFHCVYISYKDNKQTDKFYFCLSLSAVVVLLVLFSKSFFWFLPGLLWGLYLSGTSNRLK